MGDVLFVCITIAFFALAAAFVVLCDRIIGPDSDFDLLTDDDGLEPVLGARDEPLEGAVR